MDINKRIELQQKLLSDLRKRRRFNSGRVKRPVAIKRCSTRYINRFVDMRNYRCVIDDFVDSYIKFKDGRSLSLDKIKPLTVDKIEYIQSLGLCLDDYSIMFP